MSDTAESSANQDDHSQPVGLVYHDHLPVVWQATDGVPDEEILTNINYGNSQVLRAVNALEEYSSEPDEDEGYISHELTRLDMKINLLLDLVGALITEHKHLPAPVSVELGAAQLLWRDRGASLKPGDTGIAAIYLPVSPAKPLEFAGRIESVREGEHKGALQLVYAGVSAVVRDELERLIFRHHRRAVAERVHH